MAKRLTWRREPHEKGLAGVVQGERGFDLNYGGERVGDVRPRYEGWGRQKKNGYYWTARCDDPVVPPMNTCNAPVADVEEAKAQCETYVRQHLGLPPKKESTPTEKDTKKEE